jgi:hypothetical protein
MCGRGELAVPPHFTASSAGGLIQCRPLEGRHSLSLQPVLRLGNAVTMLNEIPESAQPSSEQIDGSGRVVANADCPRTRGHKDVGASPQGAVMGGYPPATKATTT